MSAICAGLGSKGKVGVQRGRETAGVPSFLPPRRGAARSRRPQTANPPAEVQRKTSCPERANTPAAVRAPRSAGAGKGAAPLGRTRLRSSSTPLSRCRKRSRPVRANPLTQFEHPAQPVQKRSRTVRSNPLTQFEHPAQPVQKRSCPVRAEPVCGSSCAPVNRCRKAPGSTRDKNFQENMRYPLAKYAKIGYYIQALFCMNSRMMLNDVKNTIIWRHSDYDRR